MREPSYKIFLSHAGPDLGIAQLLSGEIEALGAEYFLDRRDLDAGDLFRGEILDEVRDCDELLALITPHALETPWITYEIAVADALKKSVSPILHGVTIEQLFDEHPKWIGVLGDRVALPLEQLGTYKSQLQGRIYKKKFPHKYGQISTDSVGYQTSDVIQILEETLRKIREKRT